MTDDALEDAIEGEPVTTPPTVGVIGAFERDNFGDLLFLERTKKFLEGASLGAQPLSPFRDVPEQLSNQPTPAFIDAVQASEIDALWVVGGEVGGVLMHAAYRMLDPHSQDPNFNSLGRSARRRIIRARSGVKVTDFAYLPRPSRYAELHSAPFVINSAGVSGVAKLRGDVLAEAIGSLNDADFISVREQASSRLLTELGLEHRVAPDLVHTIRFDHPRFVGLDARAAARDRRVAIIQMSAATLNAAGVDALVQFLGSCEALKGFELRLLAAGLAPSHDSLELYESVVAGLNRDYPSVAVSISSATSAIEKVEEIASSSIMIGTSLHAMIISMAFDVPHVGLYLEKLARYARAWEDTMPTGVALEDAGAAVEFALANDSAVISSGIGEKLASQSLANIEAALAVVQTGTTTASRQPRAEERAARGKQIARASLNPSRVASSLLRSIIRPLS